MSVTTQKLQHHHDGIQHTHETPGLYLAFVFLFVSLSATLCTKYNQIFVKIFIRDVTLDKSELHLKLSAYGSRSANFLRDSLTLHDKAFSHNLAHMTRKLAQIFVIILS